MKKLSIITVAILLGLSGAAMAHDSGANHQDDTNSTGPNPFMPEFNTPVTHGDAGTFGYSAYAQAPVQHHVAHHHVKK
jgi:hypothetical protein